MNYLNMFIDDTKKIGELQEEFNRQYPFLKIEFLKHAYSEGIKNIKKETYPNYTLLKDCRSIHTSGNLELSDNVKVNELEDSLKNSYGLYAQVFRQSGSVWLITTATDSWTLKTQNDQGRELSEPHRDNPREEIDYHEQE